MRPLLAFCISATIIGGLWLYTSMRDSHTVVRTEIKDEIAAGEYRLELTPTCDLSAGDSFDLKGKEAPSLFVTFSNREILNLKTSVNAGTTIRSEPIPGILKGRMLNGVPQAGINEFFVEAKPAESAANKSAASDDGFEVKSKPMKTNQAPPAALRIRILRDGHPIAGAETILWGEAGDKIKGDIKLLIPATDSGEEHNH